MGSAAQRTAGFRQGHAQAQGPKGAGPSLRGQGQGVPRGAFSQRVRAGALVRVQVPRGRAAEDLPAGWAHLPPFGRKAHRGGDQASAYLRCLVAA